MSNRLIVAYVRSLAYGFVIMLLLLTWSLQKTVHGWTIPLTPFTSWIVLSWLLCYPSLRRQNPTLYSKNGEKMASYKTRALALHQEDKRHNHRDRRWTSNGVAVNPWMYNNSNTQSTDEILNPIYVFCEHLWATFLLILFGPIIATWLGLVWLWRQWKSH